MQKIGDIPNTRADSNGEFTDGNVAGGVPPTILPAEWFNTVQRELANIVISGGLALDPTNDAQLLAGLKKLFLLSSNNLSEIKGAGPAAVAQTLANLGISGNLIPVGIPLPWPAATPPDGWLKCNGSVFDKNQLPQLALVYPSGRLPDLRGEFIRGWDDGRGVDSGRTLLSEQVASSIGRYVSGTSVPGVVDATVYDPDGTTPGDSSWAGVATGMNTKTIQQQRDAVRPRNIAFNYIVRAI